ncbi:MAG: two-component system regulatory protein YycI [Firmicutes bacterium]|nr:two-component system regulatory protein YycI [Bacillota bacterium]
MDWTKAKTILIIALIAANVFLLGNIAWVSVKESRAAEVSESETLAFLASRNVYLETELPEREGKLPTLEVRYENLDPWVVRENLQAQQTLSEEALSQEKSLLAAAEAFGESCGFSSENMELEQVVADGNGFLITYKNVIDGIPIEKSYLQYRISDHRIQSVDCYWLDAVHYGETRHSITSPLQALLEFVSYHDQDGAVRVKAMELVYWLDDSSVTQDTAVLDTAFPAWKITFNNNEVEYIFAYEELGE